MIAIARWEKSHRESVTWRHERDVQERRAAIAAAEREREEARQRREAELKARTFPITGRGPRAVDYLRNE